MCRAVTCPVCGKTTWAGCGRHVDAVKASVPAGRWCDGAHDGGGQPAVSADAPPAKGFLARLLGR